MQQCTIVNDNIRDKIHRLIAKEEAVSHTITLDAHNVTVDTFSQTSNTQKDNENMILKSDELDRSDAVEKMLKGLTINDAEYYESDSSNKNDAKGNPASNLKIATHTSD